ncbi:diaminopimelate epimerase [Brevibacterium samyangense]|uniref:Diaminopimelate epimerase n=1 Tax=Brevibacterium samyangense TaxID=366888 RepID=A0ABP5EPW6_9MICO
MSQTPAFPPTGAPTGHVPSAPGPSEAPAPALPTADPRTWSLTKAHGTMNDFVLVADPAGALDVTPSQVALLCDRRAGIGGDGLIRVVRSAAAGIPEAAAAVTDGAEWFMDYRNGDGSIAEMCGNGVRAFVHYLVERGLVALDGDTPLAVGTRAGTRFVTRIPDPAGTSAPWYRVEMGVWEFPLPHENGADSLVATRGIDVARPALSVDMGNPHTVVALASEAELRAADLVPVPEVTPVPPHGTNVEYIVVREAGPEEDQSIGHLLMRVNERGVGETHACGTGACASALAARYWAGAAGPDVWDVQQPGGTVRIEVDGDTVALSGPAVLVGDVVPGAEFASAVAARA